VLKLIYLRMWGRSSFNSAGVKPSFSISISSTRNFSFWSWNNVHYMLGERWLCQTHSDFSGFPVIMVPVDVVGLVRSLRYLSIFGKFTMLKYISRTLGKLVLWNKTESESFSLTWTMDINELFHVHLEDTCCLFRSS
jgi:hypothetical protein